MEQMAQSQRDGAECAHFLLAVSEGSDPDHREPRTELLTEL